MLTAAHALRQARCQGGLFQLRFAAGPTVCQTFCAWTVSLAHVLSNSSVPNTDISQAEDLGFIMAGHTLKLTPEDFAAVGHAGFIVVVTSSAACIRRMFSLSACQAAIAGLRRPRRSHLCGHSCLACTTGSKCKKPSLRFGNPARLSC